MILTVEQLGNLAEVIMGQAPPSSDCNKSGEGTVFVKAGEFDGRFPMVREWTTNPQKLARQGDVLVCVVGATAGKVNQAIDCAIGRSVAAVRPKPTKLDTGYLFHFLTTQMLRMRGQSQGLAQGVITQDMLKEMVLPLPPIDEQRRIAAILDAADALRAKRRAALAKLDYLAQSIFIEMFGDPVANPKGWNDGVRLGDVSEIVSGITKGRRLNGELVREVHYLSVINVQDRALNLNVVKTIEATEEEIKRYRLQKNDLLLTEGGDPDKLGRGTLWNEELPECIHQNHIFRVRLTSDSINALFLNWLVGSLRGKKYFLRAAKQTTGIASINMTQLRGFPLLIPPLSVQDEFSRRIAALGDQRASTQNSEAQFEALFSSLKHRAFRGEL
jgi:type I restriction enzyme, S subunit